MTSNTNKERTSITIDPELLAEAKSFCKEHSAKSAKKLSFSELVTQALRTYIHEDVEDNQPSAYTYSATYIRDDDEEEDSQPSAYTIHAD